MNYDNIATSALGNVLTILVAGLVYIMKRKCRHSACHCHQCGIDIDISKSSDDLSHEIESGLLEMQKANSSNISPKRETALPVNAS